MSEGIGKHGVRDVELAKANVSMYFLRLLPVGEVLYKLGIEVYELAEKGGVLERSWTPFS